MDSSTNANKSRPFSQPPPYSDSECPDLRQPTSSPPPPAPPCGYPQHQQPPYPGPTAGNSGNPHVPTAYSDAGAAAAPQQLQQEHPLSTPVAADARNMVQLIVYTPPVKLYGSHRTLGCIVMICFNVVFGLVAWILALFAESTHRENPAEARRLGKASIGMSISGVIVTILIITVTLGLCLNSCSPGFNVKCVCYSTRRFVGSSCSSHCCNYDETYYDSYCYRH